MFRRNSISSFFFRIPCNVPDKRLFDGRPWLLPLWYGIVTFWIVKFFKSRVSDFLTNDSGTIFPNLGCVFRLLRTTPELQQRLNCTITTVGRTRTPGGVDGAGSEDRRSGYRRWCLPVQNTKSIITTPGADHPGGKIIKNNNRNSYNLKRNRPKTADQPSAGVFCSCGSSSPAEKSDRFV